MDQDLYEEDFESIYRTGHMLTPHNSVDKEYESSVQAEYFAQPLGLMDEDFDSRYPTGDSLWPLNMGYDEELETTDLTRLPQIPELPELGSATAANVPFPNIYTQRSQSIMQWSEPLPSDESDFLQTFESSLDSISQHRKHLDEHTAYHLSMLRATREANQPFGEILSLQPSPLRSPMQLRQRYDEHPILQSPPWSPRQAKQPYNEYPNVLLANQSPLIPSIRYSPTSEVSDSQQSRSQDQSLTASYSDLSRLLQPARVARQPTSARLSPTYERGGIRQRLKKIKWPASSAATSDGQQSPLEDQSWEALYPEFEGGSLPGQASLVSQSPTSTLERGVSPDVSTEEFAGGLLPGQAFRATKQPSSDSQSSSSLESASSDVAAEEFEELLLSGQAFRQPSPVSQSFRQPSPVSQSSASERGYTGYSGGSTFSEHDDASGSAQPTAVPRESRVPTERKKEESLSPEVDEVTVPLDPSQSSDYEEFWDVDPKPQTSPKFPGPSKLAVYSADNAFICNDSATYARIISRSTEYYVSELKKQARESLLQNCKASGLAFGTPTPGDENSFFRAISDQQLLLGLPVESYSALRLRLSKYMMDRQIIQAPGGTIDLMEGAISNGKGARSWKKYCTDLGLHTTYADEIAIFSMARMLANDILLVLRNATVLIKGDPNATSPQRFLLGHLFEKRYQSLKMVVNRSFSVVPCYDPKVLTKKLVTYETLEKATPLENLKAYCAASGYEFISPTVENGSCFFHCISLRMERHGMNIESTRKLRLRLEAHMLKHPPSQNLAHSAIDTEAHAEWVKYCRQMTYASTWADENAVFAMARMLNHDIIVVQSFPQSENEVLLRIKGGPDSNSAKPFVVGHVYKKRYQSAQIIGER